MSVREVIEAAYPGRVETPNSIENIPNKGYMVYILVYDGNAIVVGYGKRNRAKVIFDDRNTITSNHIKSIIVRSYHLFGDKQFERYLIQCKDKDHAKTIEKRLHNEIGGNVRALPYEIEKKIFDNVAVSSVTEMVLRIALNSSFDGLADLRSWRNKGILDDLIWGEIVKKYSLEAPKKNAARRR